MLNNKKNIINIITVILILLIFPVFNLLKNQICSSIMLEAIEEGNVSKLKNALIIGNPNYVPGNAYIDVLGERVDKKTPLQLACYNGNIDMVKLLVKKGADVNCVKMNAVSSPLICAIKGKSEKSIEIVKYLIDEGANVNYESPLGMRPINWVINKRTISKNDIEIVKILISCGSVKERQSLTKACFWKHNNIIKYLIKECDYSVQGGDIIQQYCRGIDDFSTEIFELLISNSADIYETDEDGKSAVDYLLETTDGDIYWVNVMEKLYLEYNS